MRKTDIRAGVDAYYAPGDPWRVVSPTRATIVGPERYRIVRRRMGAIYLVSHVRDEAGNAVLVDLHESTRVRRDAVRVRELRGLWKETLAATGRTEAGVKAHRARIAALAAGDGPISVGDVLAVAACDEGLDDDVFGVLARIADGEAE